MVRRILSRIPFALLSLLLCVAASAQTTYTSDFITVTYKGLPAKPQADFRFTLPDTSTTRLLLNCLNSTGTFTTDFGTTLEKSSNSFPISCNPTGFRQWDLNGIPSDLNLIMTGGEQIKLTIDSAYWSGSLRTSAGSAQITY